MTTTPLNELPPDPHVGFCPACGEPTVDGKIKHDPMCPYSGDEVEPGEFC